MSDDADTETEEPIMDQSEPTDEQQTEQEWHLWLAALVVGAGGLLIAFPPEFWPDIGFALVAVAIFGYLLKTVIERSER